MSVRQIVTALQLWTFLNYIVIYSIDGLRGDIQEQTVLDFLAVKEFGNHS